MIWRLLADLTRGETPLMEPTVTAVGPALLDISRLLTIG